LANLLYTNEAISFYRLLLEKDNRSFLSIARAEDVDEDPVVTFFSKYIYK